MKDSLSFSASKTDNLPTHCVWKDGKVVAIKGDYIQSLTEPHEILWDMYMAQRSRAKSDTVGYIYVIQPEPTVDSIKIGFTEESSIQHRMKEVRRWNPNAKLHAKSMGYKRWESGIREILADTRKDFQAVLVSHAVEPRLSSSNTESEVIVGVDVERAIQRFKDLFAILPTPDSEHGGEES